MACKPTRCACGGVDGARCGVPVAVPWRVQAPAATRGMMRAPRPPVARRSRPAMIERCRRPCCWSASPTSEAAAIARRRRLRRAAGRRPAVAAGRRRRCRRGRARARAARGRSTPSADARRAAPDGRDRRGDASPGTTPTARSARHAGAEDHLSRDATLPALLPRAVRYAVGMPPRPPGARDRWTTRRSFPTCEGSPRSPSTTCGWPTASDRPAVFVFVRLEDHDAHASRGGARRRRHARARRRRA